MKKLVAGLFFLSLILSSPANAQEFLKTTPDYKVNKLFSLDSVEAFTFDFEGNYLVAQNLGNFFRISKVFPDGKTETILDRTSQKIMNLSYYQGTVYIVAKGQIYKIAKGKISDVINSLPVYGDYSNSNLVFMNGAMYFAVGTATNSGVVGQDNTWLKSYPSVRDVPCNTVKISGINNETENFLTASRRDKAITGSFLPFNSPASPGQIIYGMNKCNGAVIKSAPDGSQIRVYASGLHNPKNLSIDDSGQIWVFDSGMEDRGARPIKNGKDAFYQVLENTWYGWPDFSAGLQVDQPAILADFPNIPPVPHSVFDLGQIQNLVIAPKKFVSNSAVAQTGDNKLSLLNLTTKNLQDLLNIEGKIIQYKFGPDDKLYVLGKDSGNKTHLYSIEGPDFSITSPVAGRVRSTTTMSLFWAIMLSVLASAGLYVVRNLKRPIEPL